ncbi:ABC transporter substrate-binding protein [Nonomuraea jiangxiensis]|uniref:Multiple sugar transport system substrate-binding protein n=1 Tax=Nonomuraea jiangxiensis TaxID=633440 RepID=A0A1G9ASF6_9ACTN|nr:ABC transporter substrate-binding protein [Nonomuraea jiangxiensis]SDK30249.1 multiple sugar transport system substrate-binding protein [Nonomuraea jiangxiensis]
MRRTTVTALVAAITLAVSSCGGSPEQGAKTVDPQAKVQLTWWTGQTTDAEKILEGLAAEFTRAHPNVTIDVSSGASTTDDLLQKLSAGFASGVYPDISYAFGSWASQLQESGKTLDITDKVKDPAVKWEEFPAAARTTVTPNGQVIGFPAIVDNLALLYNKSVFDARKVPYPTDDWTWDDFRAAAKKLTDPAEKIYGTAYSVSGTEDTTWHLWPLLWQRGGAILSADQKQAAFNSPQGVAALEFLRAMTIDDKSVYLDQTDQRYPALFEDGRIGMIISGPWELLQLKQKKTKYGVTMLPGTNGDHQTVSGPDLWALFDNGDANKAYWSYELVKWLTSAEGDAKWNLVQGNLPLRASEKSLPAYEEYVKTYPGAEKLVANLDNAKQARPTVSGYPEMSRYVGEAIAKALQGAATPQAALDEAATKSRQALAGG